MNSEANKLNIFFSTPASEGSKTPNQIRASSNQSKLRPSVTSANQIVIDAIWFKKFKQIEGKNAHFISMIMTIVDTISRTGDFSDSQISILCSDLIPILIAGRKH